MSSEAKIKLIANKEFRDNDELYKIIDFLNKSLKEKDIIFGLSRKGEINVISIYDTAKE